ncbi:leucine-rich repeat-containing protein kinase family protein [Rufibacter sediminis]|uniref:Protein kinase n=1 Tax=Rufibacter sediminis TaxID=2762756 RepID=A0ABR6VNW9_9BACT|nr:leucine-rich repeat-containing protein kinase family protein [Rufibacter sediminis]MBC3538863.1 protein kinase [Rufibacter sediminis]
MDQDLTTLAQLQAGKLIGATRLKLSCGLTEFPLDILDLADTLEILDLTGNRLTSLPPDFARLRKLKIAFFSDNAFTQFPAVLGQCPALEMIGFKACQIETIPDCALPPLTRWLILTNNQITALPRSIGTCTRMQKLMLAGNRLTHLPQELANCQNLELLRISANELVEVPAWLLSMPRLSWLALSGNPATQHGQVVADLPEVPWTDLQVAEVLGQGASGIISKAQWKTPDAVTKPVAVKVFKGEVTSDGVPEDEMQACMAAGAHPHLVQVLGKISQHPAQKQGLVLELIPAGYRNLGLTPSFESCTRDVYPAGTVFPLREVISIASGIASVAAHLHARGILHGDLYAHNTLVNETGHALFSDFGAATIYDKTKPELAAALERMEVRAFGYLLEDLLDHLALEEVAHETVSSLRGLQQACLQPQVLQRPDFAALVTQLTAITQIAGIGTPQV